MSTPLDLLTECLLSLKPTGSTGLEGLVRELLERWTGYSFRLARGGSQRGHDLRVDEPGAACMLAEVKRHGPTTSLSARELLGELCEATLTYPDLDLWALVATKEVGSNEVKDLRLQARRQGVEVLVLDTRDHGLGLLQVLCAVHGEVTTEFVLAHGTSERSHHLEASVEEIRASPGFSAAVERLRTLLEQTFFGFEDIRRRMAEYLKRSVATVPVAKAELGQDAALDDRSRRPPIRRDGLIAALDQWWAGSEPKRCMALLGEEGTGKTWAALQWALDSIDDADAPLLVPVTSNALGDGGVAGVVSVTLDRCTRLGKGEEWWRRRVERWLDPATPACGRVLLLLDGLNERPDHQWRALFADADARWSREQPQVLGGPEKADAGGPLFLLVTSRPGFWRDKIEPCFPSVTSVETDGYDERELGLALEHAGIQSDQVPEGLVPLVRRPRYCDLVARHFTALVKSGDLTVQHLLYLDYRDRRERRPGYPVSQQTFDEVLGELARQHLRRWREGQGDPRFTARALQDLLPAGQDAPAALQEILDGGLMDQGESRSRPSIVNRLRLVYGLGMVLAEDTGGREQQGSLDRLADEVETWLEPQPDMELKGEVLKAAVFFAMPGVTPRYPTLARQALLAVWIGARNHEEDQARTIDDAFLADDGYLTDCRVDLLVVVDHLWKASHVNHLVEEHVANALIRRRDDPGLKAELVRTTCRWMGYVHAQGLPSLRRFRRDAADGSSGAETVQRRLGRAVSGGELVRFHGWELPITSCDGHVSLADLALRVISSGDRVSFARGFPVWALARSAMEYPEGMEHAAWVLRMTDEDLWSVLAPSLTQMAESTDDTVRKAAHLLLQCLGTREAHALRQTRLAGLYPVPGAVERYNEDPCAGAFRWKREHCEPCLERDDVAIGDLVRQVKGFCIDPTLVAPRSFVARLVEAAAAMPVEAYHRGRSRSHADSEIEDMVPVLARFAPECLGGMWREVARTLSSREPGAALLLCLKLKELAPSLGPAERDVLSELVVQQALTSHEWPEQPDSSEANRRKQLEAFAFLVLTMVLPPEDAAHRLLERPGNADDLVELAYWLEPLPPGATSHLLDRLLTETEPTALTRIMWMLSLSPPPLGDEHRRVIIGALEDQAAFAALMLVKTSGDAALVEHVVGSTQCFPEPDDSWSDRYGCEILCDDGAALPLVELQRRVPLAEVGRALLTRGTIDKEAEAYAQLISVALEQEDLPWGEQQFSVKALRRVNRCCPKVVCSWVEAALGETRKARRARSRAIGFFQSLAAALVWEEPEQAFRLWRVVREDHRIRYMDGLAGTGWMTALPFKAPDSLAALVARQELLRSATSDLNLLEVATAAMAYRREDWLVGQARALVAMRPLWRRGKGLTFGALADLEAATFNDLVAAADVEGTWVGEALDAMHAYHAHNCWARHWYTQFLTAETADESLAGFTLLLRCVDRRCWPWMRQIEDELRACNGLDERRVKYRRTNHEAVRRAVERNEKERRERFLTIKFRNGEVLPFEMEL